MAVSWCTWYTIRRIALHKKRTQHGQLRSKAVCCGQSKTPIVLRQFAKVRVAGSNLVVRSTKNTLVRRLVLRAACPDARDLIQISDGRGSPGSSNDLDTSGLAH